ncbi:hypothetical protein M514_07067 [Trichuris suis]|uniref:Uncharacterized protein n=1 Tax=Trichuris suis TaxID=68888 RepID=A0A085N8P9_9BILA|nr:hypothetical protein M513_07067 [Trichuris suis]KFD65845.1 hypothetical protein M514_07067 [Trichuris suis]
MSTWAEGQKFIFDCCIADIIETFSFNVCLLLAVLISFIEIALLLKKRHAPTTELLAALILGQSIICNA